MKNILNTTAVGAAIALLTACGSTEPAQSRAHEAGTAPAAPIKVADLPPIGEERVLEHIRKLSSDEFEGRSPGSKGEELTVQYLVEQFKAIGLKPGNTDGTYVQRVPLVGITPDPSAVLTFRKRGTEQRLKYEDEFVAWTKRVTDSAALEASELVFVGYGVVAPEFNWDDYKGLDVKGKTLLMLVNDPPVPDGSNASQLDPKTFGGRAMTYYGRWTYKYEIGAQKGAAGVLLVHETGPAGYPWAVVQGMGGEQFDLVTPDKNMGRAAVEGWIHLDQAKRLLKAAGQDFEALKKRAATREFEPVPLGVTASIAIKNTLRTIDSQNVLAKLEGSDPEVADEYVVYTAHWDHLGRGTPVDGDAIYNGAADNATGTAGLIELGRAYAQLTTPPRRSILFLAVTAEEQGLLGSRYYAVTPIHPLAKTVANINMDGLNVHGRTKDIAVIGLGNSDLDDYATAVADEQGRTITPDPEPEKGFYYRSDHFNFAKQGVPALYAESGIDYEKGGTEYGRKVRDAYTANDYHKPSDEVKPDWDLKGLTLDLQFYFAVGHRVAQADRFPEWKPGTEFKAIREKQLKAGS
jgi:Zn-dependent M28 family amino/carboxypeptidase